jgi:transcriptional regulator with XRE-family HTH domain
MGGEQWLQAASERMILTRLFGARVREQRLAAGMSRTQLARKCRVPVSLIRKAELGHAGEPKLTMLLILSDGLRVAPGELLDALPAPVARKAPKSRRLQ